MDKNCSGSWWTGRRSTQKLVVAGGLVDGRQKLNWYMVDWWTVGKCCANPYMKVKFIAIVLVSFPHKLRWNLIKPTKLRTFCLRSYNVQYNATAGLVSDIKTEVMFC